MDRSSIRGGVRTKGASRIQLDFNYAGMRYRPTIAAVPTEANLRRARAKLRRIKDSPSKLSSLPIGTSIAELAHSARSPAAMCSMRTSPIAKHA
jgi:hypothetical protein